MKKAHIARSCAAAAFIVAYPCLAGFFAYNASATIVGKYAEYSFNWAWPDESSGFLVPCYMSGAGRCYLAMGTWTPHPKGGDGGVVQPHNTVNFITYTNNEPLSELRRRFIAQNGSGGRYTDPTWAGAGALPKFDWESMCVGLQYWANGYGRPGVVVPGSACGGVAPPDVSCTVLGDVLFDYGLVNRNNVDGLTLDEERAVSCTGAVSLRLKLVGDLALTPGLKSELSVNGHRLSQSTTSLPASNGVNILNFRSVLRGSTTVVGEVVASTVMILEYI